MDGGERGIPAAGNADNPKQTAVSARRCSRRRAWAGARFCAVRTDTEPAGPKSGPEPGYSKKGMGKSMNFHGKDIKIFSANSNPKLAKMIAEALGLPLGKSEVATFSDGEIAVSINESVRGSDVFVVQSTCEPVNDNLMELLIMIDAFKRASAARITAVIPYMGYARQDRKAKARDPISAKLVADLITTAGADRVLTMDLHASQIQGFFNIPVDHLVGAPILANYFRELIGDQKDDYVVVSPDLGSVTRARNFAARLDCPLAIVDKRRQRANVCEVMNIIGDVRDKKVILVDDMIAHCRHAVQCGGRPSWKRAAQARSLPRRPMRCCPARRSSVSRTASSTRWCCSIPSRCRRRSRSTNSRCSPSARSFPRRSSVSMRISPFPSCLCDSCVTVAAGRRTDHAVGSLSRRFRL